MADIKVTLINECSLSDDEVAPVVEALQVQVSRDFAPIWGINADLAYISSADLRNGKRPDPKTWWLVLLGDSDQAGALGYHELNPEGLPMGKVFVNTDLAYGSSWSNTTSHELLEMLADPWVCMAAYDPTQPVISKIYAWEVADAPEADNYGYNISVKLKDDSNVDVLVSDFVTPEWFQAGVPHVVGTKFDFMGHIKKPFELLPGGYIGVYDVAGGTGWSQVTDQIRPSRGVIHPKAGSRRHRRQMNRAHWENSSVKQ